MANENESLFLAFRRFFPIPKRAVTPVENEREIIEFLSCRIEGLSGKIGLLLSSGVDSAILAKFLPAGAIAYTIDYGIRYKQHSEFVGASRYVPAGVEHKRIVVERDAYFSAIDALTIGRKAPTVPHEPTVYIAAQQAKRDGVDVLMGGFGADSRFGGFSTFYSHTTPELFKKHLFRLYVDPRRVLVEPASIDWVIDRHTINSHVDVQRLLTEVGTEGNSAREAIELSGVEPVLPYTDIAFACNLDLAQPSKYLLNNIFTTLYGYPPPMKSALWVPYNDWVGGIHIRRPEFVPGCVITKPLFRGAPKGIRDLLNRGKRRVWAKMSKLVTKRKYFPAKRGYLLYSLDRYLHFKEQHGWVTPSPWD